MLKEHGTIKRGYLGITGQPVELPEESVKALGRDQDKGLLIVGIEEDSPAAGSGLMLGDILVGLAGEPVPDHGQLMGMLSGEIVGQETEMEVLRGGKPERERSQQLFRQRPFRVFCRQRRRGLGAARLMGAAQ